MRQVPRAVRSTVLASQLGAFLLVPFLIAGKEKTLAIKAKPEFKQQKNISRLQAKTEHEQSPAAEPPSEAPRLRSGNSNRNRCAIILPNPRSRKEGAGTARSDHLIWGLIWGLTWGLIYPPS